MDVTTDIPAARPTAVASVNCFDASTFGRTVHLTADEERRLRNVLAAVQDEALRVEGDDDPTSVASVRERFDRRATGAGIAGRLATVRLPGRDGSYVLFAAAAPY